MDRRFHNLIVNSALFAVNAIATKVVAFALIPLYTSFMDAGEYGIADMSQIVISLITPLATLSIADAAVRFMVEAKQNQSLCASLSFLITIVSIVAVAIMSPLLSVDVFGGLGHYRGWFILAYASNALAQLCGELARGLGRLRVIPFCAGLSSAVTFVAALILIGVMQQSLVGYFLSVSAGPFVATCVYFSRGGLWRMVENGVAAIARQDSAVLGARSLLRRMVAYSLPLIPNALFWWVGTSINRFFLTGMLGVAASGLFAAAGRLPNVLNTIYSVFQQAWQLTVFQESRSENISSFFSVVFRLLQAVMVISCGVLSLASPWIADVFLQGEFHDAWPMLPILLLANLASVFSAFVGTIYTTTKHTSHIIWTTAVGSTICIVLTPILISKIGTVGACIASALCQMVVLLLRIVDSRKYIAFDVGLLTLSVSIMLLVVQAAVMSIRTFVGSPLSWVCLIAVSVIQLSSLARFFGFDITGFIASRGRRNNSCSSSSGRG